MNVIDENENWRPIKEDAEDVPKGKKRSASRSVLQSLPHHDYHESKDVILPNTNLFLEKSIVNEDGNTGISWTGSKVAVVVSPKKVYGSTALMHVNERFQLRQYGDEETKQKMTFQNTYLNSLPLNYVLNVLLNWISVIEETDRYKGILKPVHFIDKANLKLDHVLRVLSSQLVHFPLYIYWN